MKNDPKTLQNQEIDQIDIEEDGNPENQDNGNVPEEAMEEENIENNDQNDQNQQ